MNLSRHIKRPSKEEIRAAMDSYDALAATLEHLQADNPAVEIAESGEKIQIPLTALRLLAKVLKGLSEGKPVQVVPIDMEVSTQVAADILNVSRPFLIKLLEDGKVPYSKVGRHRRIKFEDVVAYKKKMQVNRRELLSEMMQDDEESGLYDLD